jgi:hypothetical protein
MATVGLLRRIRHAAAIALELDAPSQNIPPVELRENAWTDEQVAALPPGQGRAVVQYSEGAARSESSMSWLGGTDNDMSGIDLAYWILRLRLPNGQFGPREQRWTNVPRVFAATIGKGDEVPVKVRDDGSLGKVDVRALKREGPPREPIKRTAWELLGEARAGLAEVRIEPDPEPPPAASMEPVDGVGFEAWIEAEAARIRRKPAPAVSGNVSAEWQRRVAADPSLRQRYAEELPAAIKRQTLA